MGVAGLRGTGATRTKPTHIGAWRRLEVECPTCRRRWVATWLAGTVALNCHWCPLQGKRTRIPTPPDD